MTSRVSPVACAATLLCMLSACPPERGGVDTGNGLSSAEMEATSAQRSANGHAQGTDAEGTTLTLLSARFHADRVDVVLSANAGCDSLGELLAPVVCIDSGAETRLRIQGPAVFDAIAVQAVPQLTGLTLGADAVDRLEIEVSLADPADGLVQPGDPLTSASIALAGEIAYVTTLEFTASLTASGTFTAPAAGLVETPGTLRAELDVSTWFDGLPITTCLDSGALLAVGNAVDLNAGTALCATLEAELTTAVHGSATLTSP